MDYRESYKHEALASGLTAQNHSLVRRACISRVECHGSSE